MESWHSQSLMIIVGKMFWSKVNFFLHQKASFIMKNIKNEAQHEIIEESHNHVDISTIKSTAGKHPTNLRNLFSQVAKTK